MAGYLLDTNIISIIADPRDPRFTDVETRLKGIGANPVALPVIGIAEIEFGMRKATNPDAQQQAAMRQFFQDFAWHLGIDDHTIEPYSLLRVKLWQLYGRPKAGGRGHIERRPEELKDRVTGRELGVDERDLLIVSVACQHNLILATNDRNEGMKRIEAAGNAILQEGKPFQLQIQYW
jgi:predicted nucleic acid-binding protein